MSTLIFDRLFSGIILNQKIRIKRGINLAHARPWVYVQGTIADGEFKLTVLDGATELATSEITAAEINAAKTLQYAHGYMRFDFSSLALRVPEGVTTKEYTFRFEVTNHTTDGSNYIAVCRIWDNRIYPLYGDVTAGEPPNDMVESVGLELYAHKYL